jgi:drug/metabolite transporter (DMT)-like permease
MGTSFVGYLIALTLTTVANAMVVLASGPVFAAFLGWIILRERVRRHTWIAIGVAAAGLVASVADGIGSGSLIGILYAFFAIFMFSLMIVLLRGGRDRDMLPAACLAGLVAAGISLLQVDSFAISAHDFELALLLGVVQNAAGFVLIALGTKRVPAAQVGLLTLTEPILAPIWAWLGAGETPAALSVAGGVFVLAAVAFNSIGGARRRPPAAPA